MIAVWGVLRFYHSVRAGVTWKGPDVIELWYNQRDSVEESSDLPNFHSNEHTFCGFRRRSSQITVSEHSYYGLDENSDQTTNSEDDDTTNSSKCDYENDLHYSPKCQKGGGRLVGNILTRFDRNGGNDNVFRNRTEWKKYYYHAVSRMPIEEEENEISSAGPSTKTTTYRFPGTSTTNATVEHANTNNDTDKHIIIHVNEFEFENNDKENCSAKKSIFQNDSSLTDGYDRNAVTSVWQTNRIHVRLINIYNMNFRFIWLNWTANKSKRMGNRRSAHQKHRKAK